MEQLLKLKDKIRNGHVYETSNHLWRIHDLLIATPEIAEEYKKESENSWYQDDVLVTEHAYQVAAVLEDIQRISNHPINRATGLIYMVHALCEIVETTMDFQELLLNIVDTAIRIEAQFSKERFLNFAYGSNMDEVQMAQRCPNAILIGKGILHNHRFALDSAGVATVLYDEASVVEGLIWSLSQSDLRTLDYREGVAIGCYRKEIHGIDDGTSQCDAIVYVSQREIPKKPKARDGYMEKISEAAERHNLSAYYREKLKCFLPENNE